MNLQKSARKLLELQLKHEIQAGESRSLVAFGILACILCILACILCILACIRCILLVFTYVFLLYLGVFYCIYKNTSMLVFSLYLCVFLHVFCVFRKMYFRGGCIRGRGPRNTRNTRIQEYICILVFCLVFRRIHEIHEYIENTQNT